MAKVRRIVRVQKDLYEQIRVMTQRQQRSLSAQIMYFFHEAVARDQSAGRFCEAEAGVLGRASQAAQARESA